MNYKNLRVYRAKAYVSIEDSKHRPNALHREIVHVAQLMSIDISSLCETKLIEETHVISLELYVLSPCELDEVIAKARHEGAKDYMRFYNPTLENL